MRRICCYCHKESRDKLKLPPGLPAGSVTHIICKACLPRANAEVDAAIKKLKERDNGKR